MRPSAITSMSLDRSPARYAKGEQMTLTVVYVKGSSDASHTATYTATDDATGTVIQFAVADETANPVTHKVTDDRGVTWELASDDGARRCSPPSRDRTLVGPRRLRPPRRSPTPGFLPMGNSSRSGRSESSRTRRVSRSAAVLVAIPKLRAGSYFPSGCWNGGGNSSPLPPQNGRLGP